MKPDNKFFTNYQKTREQTGYKPRHECTLEDYQKIGFMSGLEIHQQIDSEKKLFCRCPAGHYHDKSEFDAEVVRHMRPTLSELGEYDGTALMEFKTRKNIFYHLKYETACTYEVDDTPPFLMNEEAMKVAIEIALLLKQNIVGELHITRKQYLDGSIPTGFQRTGIVGVAGSFPLGKKEIRLIQMSIEEDSCREVSDIGHDRVYVTDRLGMPLVEMVTHPDFKTPDEVAEGGQYLRYLTRSTGKVRTGMGAARQDVNVSVTGGTRVEIKGVPRIRSIPELTHHEAFRQVALLAIRDELKKRWPKGKKWSLTHRKLKSLKDCGKHPMVKAALERGDEVQKINLPAFGGLMSFYTGPQRMFADEISDRLKVIACIEKPNMIHSEMFHNGLPQGIWSELRQRLEGKSGDAQIILWGPKGDIDMALETITERCELAFLGVPNETRKSMPDGSTIFERVLPGPDRMYPDTDSVPIPISEKLIAKIERSLPKPISHWQNQLKKWKAPEGTHRYLLSKNLCPQIQRDSKKFGIPAGFLCTLWGQRVKQMEGIYPDLEYQWVSDLIEEVSRRGIHVNILKALILARFKNPQMTFDGLLGEVEYKKKSMKEIIKLARTLGKRIDAERKQMSPESRINFLMGLVAPVARGNVDLRQLKQNLTENNHE